MQRSAQQLLRQSDQQLRSIIDSVQDYAIFLLDTEGYVATWNPGAQRIKGYTADEIIGHPRAIPEDMAQARATVRCE
ncbi:MAG: PAS domain S-box protein [Acidobacteriaceae bacterium]